MFSFSLNPFPCRDSLVGGNDGFVLQIIQERLTFFVKRGWPVILKEIEFDDAFILSALKATTVASTCGILTQIPSTQRFNLVMFF